MASVFLLKIPSSHEVLFLIREQNVYSVSIGGILFHDGHVIGSFGDVVALGVSDSQNEMVLNDDRIWLRTGSDQDSGCISDDDAISRRPLYLMAARRSEEHTSELQSRVD